MDPRHHRAVVGRAGELSALDLLVANLTEGRGGAAWVEGEPGVGKSVLVDVPAATAADAGFRVLRNAGDELMEAFPLRLMADCLGVSARSQDPAIAAIAALLRGETGGSGALDPVLVAGERMLELVDRACAAGPVVLVVEDLHWADEPSLLIWSRLARAVGQIPLLLIGTARPVPHRDTVEHVRELVDDRGGVVLRLGPLAADDVVELAARTAGGRPGPRLRAELERAGGNPLYVRELVDALVRDGLVVVDDGAAELRGGAGTTPSSLTVAIGRRLRFLGRHAQEALRTAALLGNEFDVGEWASVVERPVSELTDIVADALAGGVLSAAGPRLRFRHELIRQVLAEQIPRAIRVALHGQIARTLAGAGGEVDAVARHLLAVPDRIEDWALTWLTETGEAALYAAPEVAAELLERAVGSLENGDPRWEVLATRLALVAFWLGRDEQCARVGAEVVARTRDPELAARMRIRIIRCLGRLNRFADALAFGVGTAPGDDRLPAVWRARLAAWSSLAVLLSAPPDRGRDEGRALAHEALRLAVRADDRLGIGYARHALSIVDDPRERSSNMQEALAVLEGQAAESADIYTLVLGNYVFEAMHRGLPDVAEANLARLLVLTERIGAFRGKANLITAATLCYEYGRWDEALVHLADADQPDMRESGQSYAVQGHMALIALHREDRATADAHLRGASVPDRPRRPLTNALALRAEVDGDLDRALSLMAGWLDVPPGLLAEERQQDLPHLVQLALAVGDHATARAAAEAARADAAGESTSPMRAALARFTDGLVSGDVDALLGAASDFNKGRWRLHAADAFRSAAVHLARAGDVARARAALTDAVRLYSAMGATWDIRRADADLRRYGVRRGPHSVHRRATTGWEALTPSEHHIARLVAQGKSNPDIATELFLSRRTVQTHVSNILAKLQLQSRMEVMRDMAGHSPATGRPPREAP